jgi:hypothetical protein
VRRQEKLCNAKTGFGSDGGEHIGKAGHIFRIGLLCLQQFNNN